MSEGIVHADVKFKKHQKTEGKDGASTGNDATYSEISIPKAGRNQTSTDTDAGDPDSQKGLKVKPGGYDPVKVVLVTLCFLLMGMVIGLRFLYISNLPTKNTELQILQAAYNRNLTSALMIKNRELQELQVKNKDLQEKERALRQQNEELRKQKTPPSCPTNTGNNDGPQPMNCAEGWEYYGGKCYYFSPDKLTWAQSRDECITRGGHLVIIESIEEQIFLDQKTGTKISTDSEDKFWIGLTDSINENEWLWVDNSSLSTSFWLGDQEPDDWKGENPDGEDCARMGEPNGTIDGKSWLDVICNTTQRRICETKSPL
ncbi:asialoglycoprotein receptor 1-like isoform X2 [Oncorhynchus tshawytscha]|uniref:asialoglycoprotein receptor 1-like isoform X2 n=1 Tax=Oncorhynchus tshawytscha TaxID=74940 RepID=UPI001C3C7573|nr:asialoglycoprotein receptor 1-like isoform X2 [Oncorhynchus tshawytscha]